MIYHTSLELFVKKESAGKELPSQCKIHHCKLQAPHPSIAPYTRRPTTLRQPRGYQRLAELEAAAVAVAMQSQQVKHLQQGSQKFELVLVPHRYVVGMSMWRGARGRLFPLQGSSL
jgi:hypothetical protein